MKAYMYTHSHKHLSMYINTYEYICICIYKYIRIQHTLKLAIKEQKTVIGCLLTSYIKSDLNNHAQDALHVFCFISFDNT